MSTPKPKPIPLDDITDEEFDQIMDEIHEEMESGTWTDEIRREAFTKGATFSYEDENDPNILITEFPNGTIRRETLAEARERLILEDNDRKTKT